MSTKPDQAQATRIAGDVNRAIRVAATRIAGSQPPEIRVAATRMEATRMEGYSSRPNDIRNCSTYQNSVAMVENSKSAAATCAVGGKSRAIWPVWYRM